MSEDEEPPSAPTAAEMHAPVLKRLREAGHHPRAFQQRRNLPWIISGAVALVALILIPLKWPDTSPWAERVATALALFWLVTGVAVVLKLRRSRAPWIGLAVTIFLYIATAWLPFIGVQDLFVLTVLVGFGVFVLAGFNLLFVLEEMVYDAHRLLHLRGRIWKIAPLLLALGLIPVVYYGEPIIGVSLGTLRFMVPFGVVLLLIGWIIRWRIHPAGEAQLRELHLVVVGAIAGAGLADAVGLLHEADGIIPSLFAYLTFIGTWVYVSFTTLQRAQYFLRAKDVLPWIAILLSSSFAVLAHVHSLYAVAGRAGLEYQLDLRVGYLVFGVWLGLTFFVLRGIWRMFEFIRDARGISPVVRRTAGTLARVTEELVRTEDRLEGATSKVLQRVDRILPGEKEPTSSRSDRRRHRRYR